VRPITSEVDLNELSRDAGIITIRPSRAVVAESDEDVVKTLSESRAQGTSVTPRGAGTSIPSQAVGRGTILLQVGIDINPESEVVTCGPTVSKSDLNKKLDYLGVWVPPDPSSYQTCTIGGMVANNSSGARTLKYGSTVDFVKELRIVLPEEGPRTITAVPLEDALHGDQTTRAVASLIIENSKKIEDERPRVTKNSCGYRLEKVVHDGILDLPKLFSGSEGTLGVFTGITLSTRPKPRRKVLTIVEASLKDLDRVASTFRKMEPAAIELVDKSVFRLAGRMDKIRTFSRTEEEYLIFCELDGRDEKTFEEALHRVADSEIAAFDPITITDPGQISEAWEIRNETLTLATDLRKGTRILVPGVEDLVAPQERLGELIALVIEEFESRGLDYISYGHAGDANLHMRPFLDPGSQKDMVILEDLMEECFEGTWKMGGSITGEHGDGMLRARFVSRQYPQTYEIMTQIRNIYDPKRLLNPDVKIV
jgi:FAD/FMN-containing dehydrogenase